MTPEEVKVHTVKPKVQPKKRIPHTNGRMMDFAPRRCRPTPQQERMEKATVADALAAVEEAKQAVEPEPVQPEVATIVPPGTVEKVEQEPAINPEDVQRAEPVEPVVPASYRPIPPSHDPKSPFLSSVSVQKRPLSGGPTARPAEYTRDHNVYHPNLDPAHELEAHQTKLLPEHNQKRMPKAPMITLIVATIAIAVAMGFLIYFSIFK